jgi:phosphohistidine phosphatase SixA
MIRTRETAEPLERDLRLKAEAVSVQDVDALVAKLRALAPGSVALVVNHSGTIPKIVEKLGGGTMQLNPHFLFNTLNTLGVLMKEDTTEAGRLLVRLSDLLRSVLGNNSSQPRVKAHFSNV